MARRAGLLAHVGTMAAGCAVLCGVVLSGVLTAPLAWAAPNMPPTTTAPKVLRYAFPVAETGFDPATINDLYSRSITPHIFESLYTYDHLARPAKLKPLTALGMPVGSSDFRTWTVKLQPGIYFADDPAFKGQRRELVAQDYVYALKRFADPATRSPGWPSLEIDDYAGLNALRQEAVSSKKPFNYDREIEGVRALDRYTIQFKVGKPRPRFVEGLAASDVFGAVAREVVDAYGDQISAHPVGTGPFVLKQWRRSSLIVLEKNPHYRERVYDAEPNADDAEGLALAARFKGRRIPMIDRVEVSIIDEQQPRWLAFLNGQTDLIQRIAPEFINVALPNGRVAPNLAKLGVQSFRILTPDVRMTIFNLDDPTVGGMSPEKVALRRAICLGLDSEREIRLAWRGQGTPAHSPLVPHTTGFDPAYTVPDYSPARARALLDLFGYVDKDGDGWRDLPNGEPLLLVMATQPDQQARQFDELFKRHMDALRIRVRFAVAKWPENLKAVRAGKLMLWMVGSSATAPDGQSALARMYGPEVGGSNLARFQLPAFDAIYEQMMSMPDGPERLALFDQAKRIASAYAPYKFRMHSLVTDMAHPALIGYRRPVFWQDFWAYLDIAPALQTQR